MRFEQGLLHRLEDGAVQTFAFDQFLAVHRVFGVADDLPDILVFVGFGRQSEGDAGQHLLAAKSGFAGIAHFDDSVDDLFGGCAVGFRQADDEFVAAPAGDQVFAAAGAPEQVCDGLEQLVAVEVAVDVVDQLEAVDVAHDNRERQLAGGC